MRLVVRRRERARICLASKILHMERQAKGIEDAYWRERHEAKIARVRAKHAKVAGKLRQNGHSPE
ncbi:hypothetical protein COU19_00355 [Candidatus Kaiserbacteria bacterium CG10_big_fil_rev_8_21_14_0_10_56_12]|uniref:Uncharacterized protein n=1 Tax=Candidatus Kaiserbacteria bacterium CG10_big_fil_rev_8_21_14_0_10_56_12 TaxID=1974611 RepID=A0A2H0UCG7_9BACT|nr:MAG: hypothetical protein COU19_00355 [Candidatus Kaiserbacteria bacterium CG10_big_fil_rev_8_21_14_0_10_56_12]